MVEVGPKGTIGRNPHRPINHHGFWPKPSPAAMVFYFAFERDGPKLNGSFLFLERKNRLPQPPVQRVVQSKSTFRQDTYRDIGDVGVHHHHNFWVGVVQVGIEIPVWKTTQAEVHVSGPGVHPSDFPAESNNQGGLFGVSQGPEHGFTPGCLSTKTTSPKGYI